VFIYVFMFSFVPLDLATHCAVLEEKHISIVLKVIFDDRDEGAGKRI
jgi:hypothetical protein